MQLKYENLFNPLFHKRRHIFSRNGKLFSKNGKPLRNYLVLFEIFQKIACKTLKLYNCSSWLFASQTLTIVYERSQQIQIDQC